MKPLVVHFDQNCMNARGGYEAMNRLDDYVRAGRVEIYATARHELELEDARPSFAVLARKRLAPFPVALEQHRLDVSPLDVDGIGLGGDEENPLTDFARLWPLVFPQKPLPSDEREWTKDEENSVHDVVRIANAEDVGADVFLTDERALLKAGPRLGLRVRIMKPEQLVEELEAAGER
jgi:hypothetical protein